MLFRTRFRHVLSGALLGLLACGAAAPVAAQSNTWILLSPTPSTRWEPADLLDCSRSTVSANPVGRGFAGSAYGNGRILYWGGGHASYPGNDVDLYDIAQNRWIADTRQPECLAPCCDASGGCWNTSPKVNCGCDNFPVGCSGAGDPYNPSCLSGSCFITGGVGASKPVFRCAGGSRAGLVCSQDADCTGGGTCSVGIPTPGTTCTTCRPYTEHSYQRQAYNPARGTFLIYALSGTWEWNPGSRAWTWLGPPPTTSGDQSNRVMMWDPVRARMTFFQFGGGNSGVYTFSYATNTWTKQDAYLPTGNTWCEVFGFYDGRANKFVIFAKPGAISWYVYNPALTGSGAWTNITAGTPPDLRSYCPGGGAQPCFTSGLTYDATNQRTIALTQDPGSTLAVWAYDALADSWQKFATGNETGVARTGYPNQLHYDPGTASLFLIDVRGLWTNGPGSNVRTLKISLNLGNPLPTNTVGSPTATPPFTPTAPPTSTGAPTFTPTPRPTTGPATPTSTPGGPTPTCAGTIRQVGPGRTYSKPSQAAAVVQSNDCVHIDAGTYENDVTLWPSRASNVTIRGINGRAVLTVTNGSVYGSKGIWVVAGANTTIENIEFSCASSRSDNPHCSGVLVGDSNDAGIRIEAPGLTVRNCVFHDNDNGILGGPNISGTAGDVLIEHSEFYRNGLGDGFTHNLYLNSHNASLTFRYNYTHGAITGHLLKSRAAANYILYNRLMDEDNGVTTCTNQPKCMASAQVELPCGGIAYVVGNLIQKGVRADSRDVVKFAAELGSPSCLQPPLAEQELYVVNNTMVSDYGSTTYFIRGFGTAPLLWAKNNIFWGASSQPISWPAGGTKLEQANVSADPKLLSQATYDYRLTSASTAVIDKAIDPGSDSLGFDLLPSDRYVYDRSRGPRTLAGAALDSGAFELIAGASPFPTPTATPSNTPTTSPVPTNTPSTPLYCGSGQSEAVFPIADSADDGIVERSGGTYTALSPSYLATGGYANYIDYAIRKNSNGNYKVGVAFFRWNTGTRPDGSAWPAGTQIVGAYLRPAWAGAGTGPRPLVFEWHNWAAPLSQSNWVLSSPAAADPTYAGTSARPTAKGRQTIALTNAAGNVTLVGYTGLRMMIEDSGPPAAGEDNTTPVRPKDYLTSVGDQSAQLVLCYSQGPPQPPSAPRLL